MSKNNVRIAIRDSTDSHNVAFFDNKAGIKYKSANLHRFLAGSASILTIKYNSKDIDTIRSGCKLAFRYKNRDYWLNVMSFEKKGFEVELTAYSLGLELNNETRGEHKPANAMSITEYVAYYDPEHALTIGVNEVSDKRIKLEWTGTDTILARLFSVANSFGAELDFNVELNDDYSLKRQVLNIYKKGNLGTNKVSQPVRVGKELKVINYSDNIKELRTAVRATGKDGLTIDGLDKKIYDNNKELLYYSSGMTVYAPQSRDRFPSVGKGSNDNWIVKDLGETQYETKEALWGYMYGEIQKISVPEITYEVEGAIEAGIGDTQTLIDGVHFEPALYVQARVSELEDDILTGKVTKSTFINFERKYSQIADILLKQVEALAEDAAPYIIRLSTNNGYIFKNGEGSSTITARLEKYSKDIAATWKWVVDNKVVGTGDKLTVKAEQVTNTMAVTVIAYVNGNEVVRDYMTFSNSDDGVGVESIDRYFTSSDQSDGVTIEGAEWSDKPPAPTEDGKYLWAYDEITYTDGTVTTTKPAAVGANFDVDAFRAEIAEDLKDVPNREEFENKIAEELANSKAEIETQIETAKTQAESNAKEYADTINQETAKVAELANAAADEIKADLVNVKNNLTDTSLVANNAQAAVDAAKQELTEVANELSTAKQDLTNSVAEVNTKVNSTKAELTQAKQDLISHAQQLQTQANAQTELSKRVTSVETTANGTKTTVNELTKTVAQNGKDITSVTARTKVVEDDLAGTKTTLSQVKTTADSASQKTATLETGLNGLSAKFSNLKIGGANLLLYSADPSKAPSGYYDFTNAQKTSETYNGSVVYKVRSIWGGLRVNLGNLADRGLLKIGDVLTYSVAMRAEQEKPIQARLFIRYKNQSDADSPTGKIELVNLTNEWQYFSVTFTVTAKMLAENTKVTFLGWELTSSAESGKYVYYACNKIERGNIATDYSPSDADIEQKVAEYKQNADQNYASLQTTVQNLDGTVKQNKSEFEQTASQITSAVSAVEGKIPTEIGSVNLFKGSRDFSGTSWVSDGGVYAEDYRGVKVFKKNSMWNGRSQYFEVKTGEEYVFSAYVKSSAKSDGVNFYLAHESKQPMASGLVRFGSDNRQDNVNIGLTDKYKRIAVKIKITKDGWIMPRIERYNSDNYLFFGGYKLERGTVATDWEPAPEDTISQISSLSSELKQTKDGITLLATKTELNSAKTELQSGITTATNKANSNAQTISTHTTQISALNTGLSAKVSQSDFNTLSGRVTTAENNITAKANELSSKITTVEGKIPTGIGAVNLFKGSRDFSGSWMNGGSGAYAEDYQGVKIFKKNSSWGGLSQYFEVKTGEEYVFSAYVKSSAKTDGVNFYLAHESKQPMASGLVNSGSVSGQNTIYFELTDKYKRIAIKIKITQDGWIAPRLERGNANAYLFFGGYKLERGNIASDWSPAHEDYDSKLASAQSEFKQTTDAIKASVSSLDKSTVKSSSLTINADGIVMKAGKSTTDVANAIGSYFAVNQNAINLFSDKINVKGNMIVSGAITSDKIASKSINTAHLNGKIITADVIATNAITANAIKAGAVTTDKMSANSINGDRIAAGTLDAAKIKAGSITASQIASGTITSNQIKAGGISSANIAAGAITTDKIAAGAIDANKIAANAITANMIRGGKLNSTNGATVFDLNAGTLTFNNNSGYIQRVASDKIFEITTYLGKSLGNSQEYLTSDFTIRKSDNSRRSGIQFQLYTMVDNQPTATAKINADSLNLYNSQNTKLFSINGSSTWLGNFNMQGWGDIPVAQIYGGLLVKDIGIGGRSKSLLKIVEELCNKTGIWWM